MVEESSCERILFSNVVVKRKRNLFSGRTWRTVDIQVAATILAIHLLSLFAPFMFSWTCFWLAVVRYVVSGIFGITLSFHRNLAHRSFKLPKLLEYFFAYIGSLSLQRDPITWVSTHRYHHQYVDTDMDPHSPTQGFWFSHMGWLFDSGYLLQKYKERKNVGDLKKQWFYKFMKRTYLLHNFGFAVILYLWGGFPFLVWGMGVAGVWGYHATFLVNSACHVWGTQAWNTGDLSKNNWWVAMVTFGEGWHNNHHAFDYSARQGLEWWQIDVCWYVIRFLQVVGLATDVKLPNEAHKRIRSFPTHPIINMS